MSRKPDIKNRFFKYEVDKIQKAIIDYRRENRISPSIREIASMTGKGTTTVFYYINYLDSVGWLMPRKPGMSRNLIPISELEMTNDPRPAEQDTQVSNIPC